MIPDRRDIHVTGHALDRYREHVPGAYYPDVLDALDRGEEISATWVAVLCARNMNAVQDTYILAPDRRGILVLAASVPHRPPVAGKPMRPYSVVTYIRLSPSQIQKLEP